MMSEFIGVHRQEFLAIFTAFQIPASFFLMFMTLDQKSLTPRFECGKWSEVVHILLRLFIATAYLGVMFGACLSTAGILIGSEPSSIGTNDLGVTFSHISGTIAYAHLLSVAGSYLMRLSDSGK